MAININNIRNKSKEDRNNELLRKLPFALRRFYARTSSGVDGIDEMFQERETNDFLQKFESVKYPITDAVFGSNNERITNIYTNHLTDDFTHDLIKDYLDNKRWIYHPVRDFEDWRDISYRFYRDEDQFWAIIVFNKITDPFQALKDLSVIRIPDQTFVFRLRSRYYYNYGGGKNIDLQA